MRVNLASKTTFPLLRRDYLLEIVQNVALEGSNTSTKSSDENNRKVMLSLPSHANRNLTDRIFYRAQNLRADALDTLFRIDVLTGRDYLFQYPLDSYFKFIVPFHELEEELAAFMKDGVYENAITLQFKESIVSIARTALRDMNDKDTLEAISFLFHVAQSGKKIIVVYSHGDTDHKSGRWKLTGFEDTVYANDVIESLSEEFADGQNGAIFFIACNKDNLPVKPIKLPVVIHTDESRTSFQNDFNAPAKVYWPS